MVQREPVSKSDECLAFFQKGVALLQQLASDHKLEARKVLPLAWGSGKLPVRRQIAVEKAKVARLYGRASLGHGARKSRQGAFTTHSVKRFGQNTFQWLTELLLNILCFFKPNTFNFWKICKKLARKQIFKMAKHALVHPCVETA